MSDASENGARPGPEDEPVSGTSKAPIGTEPAVCPVCSRSWEPMPFYRERRTLYSHLKAEHNWSVDQVDDFRGKKPKAAKPKPEGTVSRPAASPQKVPKSATAKKQTDFARRLQRMGEVQPRVMTSGNTLLLQGVIMLGWFPPPLLVEFKSDPQTGMPLPQWDRPTEFGRAVMLDEREAMVYAAAWAFSEDTALLTWVEERIGTVAPVLAALACAVVTAKHLSAMRALANSPAVVAFKDQLAAAMAQAQRQAEAEAEARRQAGA